MAVGDHEVGNGAFACFTGQVFVPFLHRVSGCCQHGGDWLGVAILGMIRP